MTKEKHPVTAAVRVLREHGVAFTHHPYTYEERGGTEVSARELGVPEHAVVKTLVMEDDAKRPCIVLMHGDHEGVDEGPRALPRRQDRDAVRARRRGPGIGLPGRRRGPFGTRRAMPVYMERSIADLPYVYVNGGRRGYLVGMAPADLARVLNPVWWSAAA